MPSYCQVRLLGYAARDADIRVTPGGKSLALWSMAVPLSEVVQWHRCQAWNKMAEIAARIHKGDLVEVEGTIYYQEYKGKEMTYIVASRVYLFGRRAIKEDEGIQTELSPEELAERDKDLSP